MMFIALCMFAGGPVAIVLKYIANWHYEVMRANEDARRRWSETYESLNAIWEPGKVDE